MKYLPRVIITLILTVLLSAGYVPIVSAQSAQTSTISVKATVLPRPEDFQFKFTSDVTTSTVGADQEIEYTITYGSSLDYATPITLEAQWSHGTVNNDTLNSYDIVSYVAGSATSDYWAQTNPIVDVKNRTITWTHYRYPRNTIDKTVRFRLKTPGRYITEKQVDFTVTARIKPLDTTIPEIQLHQTYNPTEFIQRAVRGLRILTIDIRRITNTSFGIFLVTTEPARTVISYGTDEELSQSITDANFSEQKLIIVDGLEPVTTYYFKILIENARGILRKTPEMFQVITSSSSLLSRLDRDNIVLGTFGIFLDKELTLGSGSSILMPLRTPLGVYLPFLTDQTASAYLTVVPHDVRGTSTPDTLSSLQKLKLLEVKPKAFSGQVLTPDKPGTYDLLLEVNDKDGTLAQDILTILSVTNPITIKSPSGAPIEKALVYIERYNDGKGAFEYFPADTFGAKNPDFTDHFGTINTVLPDGEYMVNVNALGYKTKQETFLLNTSDTRPYPTLTLEPAPFSLMTYISYYWHSFVDNFSFAGSTLDSYAASNRYRDLAIFVSLLILTGISVLLSMRRIKLSLEGLLIYLEKHIRYRFDPKKSHTLFVGFVEDQESESPVHAAVVTLVSNTSHTVVARDVTSILGKFEFALAPGEVYELQIKKRGYGVVNSSLDTHALFEQHTPFQIHRDIQPFRPIPIEFLLFGVRSIFHVLADAFLVAVVILHILLIGHLGIIRALPLTIITSLNITLWIEYHWKRWKTRKAEFIS